MADEKLIFDATINVDARELEKTQKQIQELAKQLRGLRPASEEYQKILIELAKQGKIFEQQSKAAQKFSQNTSKFVGQSVDDIIADLRKEGKAYDDLRQRAKQAADTQQEEGDQALKTLRQLKDAQERLNRVIKDQGIGSADFKRTQRELQNVNAEVRKIEDSFRSTGAALFSFRDGARTVFRTLISRGVNELINGFRRLTRGITGFAKDSIRAFSEFEKQIDRVGALTGATVEQLDRLSKQARELGATTAFSASEAAQAQQFLAQAGFNVDEIYSALPSTLELAAAGQLDLAKAADIASNVLSGLGLPVEDLGRVNDVLAKTANTANTNISQLGNAFAKVAPVAASAGVTLEETAAAIGILGNSGIQGGAAGTALRNILISLQAPSGAAAESLARLGIQTQDAEGKFIGLTNILDQFAKVDATPKDFKNLFGKQGIAAFNILLNEGSEGFAAYSKELENAGGTAADVANKQLDNLAGDFVRVQSATEGLQIALGDLASGPLREVVGGFAELLGALTNAISGQDLTAKQSETVKNTLTLLGQVLVVVAAAYLTLSARGQLFIKSLQAQLSQIRNTTGAVNKLGVAFRGLGRIVAGLGIGIAISALIEVIDNLRKSLDATADITADFESAQAKATVQAQKETEQLNKLFDQLKKTENGTIARRKAINELNENYGEYIGNLEDEEGNLVDIETAQRAANEQLVASLRLKANTALLEKYTEQLVEEEAKLQQLKDAQKESTSAFDEGVSALVDYTSPLGVIRDVTRELGFREASEGVDNFGNSVKRTLGSTRAAVEQDLSITQQRIAEFNTRIEDLFRSQEDLRKRSGEVDRESARLAEEESQRQEEALKQQQAAYREQIRLAREQIGILNKIDSERARSLGFEQEDASGNARIRLLREIADLERGIIERSSKFELSIAGLTANERIAIEQEAANDIIEINRKLRQDLAEIRASQIQPTEQQADPGFTPSQIDPGEATAIIQSAADAAYDKVQPTKGIGPFGKAIGLDEKDGLQQRIEKIAGFTLSKISDLSTGLFDVISSFAQANIDRLNSEIDAITGRIDATNSRVEEIKQKEITATGQRREELERERVALQAQIATDTESRIKAEQEVAKEEQKIARQKKAQNITQAIINTAQSILATGAQLGYPQAFPFQAIAAAIGAAQIAAISAQQFEDGGLLGDAPKFAVGGVTARGGISRGAPHSRGGVKLFDSATGRVTGEIEGNEVILTKGVTQNPRLLRAASAINVAGGGKSFFQGGGTLADVQQLGGVNTQQISQQLQELTVAELRGLRADFRNIQLVVDVNDINTVQGEVQQNSQRVQVIQ